MKRSTRPLVIHFPVSGFIKRNYFTADITTSESNGNSVEVGQELQVVDEPLDDIDHENE